MWNLLFYCSIVYLVIYCSHDWTCIASCSIVCSAIVKQQEERGVHFDLVLKCNYYYIVTITTMILLLHWYYICMLYSSNAHASTYKKLCFPTQKVSWVKSMGMILTVSCLAHDWLMSRHMWIGVTSYMNGPSGKKLLSFSSKVSWVISMGMRLSVSWLAHDCLMSRHMWMVHQQKTLYPYSKSIMGYVYGDFNAVSWLAHDCITC